MGKKILVVDDDPKTLKLIRDVLQWSGYEIIEATNGKDGVKLAKNKKPDLILMDVIMPKMEGFSAAHAIKTDQATKEIPVIMLTSVDPEAIKEFGKGVVTEGYITKPFGSQELLSTISRLLPSLPTS